jgi:Tfp pilus assembly protein PilO
MASYLDKLNLRPQERRLVVGIAVVVFVVLNVWLVWPKFREWKRVKADLHTAHTNLDKYRRKISQVEGPNGFKARLKVLEGEGAHNIVADEQEIQLLRTVQNQVKESQITVTSYGQITRSSSTQSTNDFFEEQSIKIAVNTGEEELIDFLLKIGAGSSMIRVRDLDLKPADQNRYKLQGSITLSANYQKKPAKAAPTAAKPSQPALKPAPSGVKKS